MKFEDLLGYHGVVVRVDDVARASRAWRSALDLGPARRMADGSRILGPGTEFFLVLRPAGPGAPAGLEQLHVAVRGLRGRAAAPDSRGGRGRKLRIEEWTLVVREISGPPDSTGRPGTRRSRPSRSRPGGRGRGRPSGRDNR